MRKIIQSHYTGFAADLQGKIRKNRAKPDEQRFSPEGKGPAYLEMKDWFLDKFPAIRAYHEKREELMNAVAEREAKRKEKLKAKKTVA